MQIDSDIAVIGAGVIGITTALALQAQGHRVVVLDRKGVCAETSAGNAGAFAFSEVIPLATPGVMRKAPKWLLDPLGPLSVPPYYALKILPWLLRFWRASWRDRYEASVAAQSALMHLGEHALDALIADVDAGHLVQPDGQLALYEGQASFDRAQGGRDLMRANDIPFDEITTAEGLAQIQPGLASRFTHGVFTPTWRNTVDPKKWVQHLAQVFQARGGQIETCDVTSLAGGQIHSPDAQVRVQKIVLCAGAWSHHLAQTLGHKIPLETERGYNTTLPPGAFDLRSHITFSDHGFVVSRINGGVRVGGAVELGGLEHAPNYKRADVLLEKAKRFLPDLDPQGGTQWMGYRPSLPDSLPVIDFAPGHDHVIYAFGHGHLGLTQSAVTAQLVADLVAGQGASLNMHPYRATRF
jgi:D-amino-acid dehydrogenase